MAALLAVGCDEGGTSTPLDVSTDDMGTDLTDTGTDTSPETVTDTIIDTTPGDTGTDTTMDTMTDPTPDPGTDDGSPTGGVVGDACSVTADCSGVPGAGRLCLTDLLGYLTFSGGYCSAACTSGSDCGTGGDCVEVMSYNYCLKTCTSAADCRTGEGYTCTTLPEGPTGTYCLPPAPDPESATDY
jgi:hypothetical protein